MNDEPITILVVEESSLESRLNELRLAGAGGPGADGRPFRVVRAEGPAGAVERLGRGGIEAVVLDLHLPDSTGLSSVARVRERAPNVPIVVLTSCRDEAVAIEALRHGADDLLVKSEIGVRTLARVLRYMIERTRSERRARAAEDGLRSIVKSNADAMIVADTSGVVRFVNPAAETLLGRPAPQIVGTCFDFPLVVGEAVELDIDHPSGRRSAEMRVVRATWGGEPARLASLRDITQHKRAAEAIRQSHEKYKGIVEDIGIGIVLVSLRMEILELNRAMRERFPAAAADGRSICHHVFCGPPRATPCEDCPVVRTFADGGVHEIVRTGHARGSPRAVRIVSSPVRGADGTVVAATEMVEDVTAKLAMEDKLRRSQTLEAIGELAGGVAHDFNNLVMAIKGYASLALQSLPADHPARLDVEYIARAGQRAADLTRRLLAFARREPMDPVVLDLNDAVGGAMTVLKRLIGDDIDLRFIPAADAPAVRADAGRIEQILMDLAINARDAMPEGGRLTIETAAVAADARDADGPDLPGADCAMIAVTDTGCGMDAHTQSHVFEPFFTTKEVGRGTGLGLSTVYGIVRQHGGTVQVRSEPGRGTTFRIYLPRVPAGERADPADRDGQEALDEAPVWSG